MISRKVRDNMDRYKTKYEDGKNYVVDTLCEDKVVSSGYYKQEIAEEFCDRMNLQEDSSNIRN